MADDEIKVGAPIPQGAQVGEPIPEGATIGERPQQPSWAGKAWDKVKHFTGLDEGALFGGSGEAGGVAGAVTTPEQVLSPLVMGAADVAAPAIGAAVAPVTRKLGSMMEGMFPRQAEQFPVWRDATHLNKVPFAGEEMESSAPSWRDATKLNEPYAGEAPETGWHSKLPNRMPEAQPQLGSPENPGWNTKLSDRLNLPKPQFEPIGNSPNIANQRYLAEQGKAVPVTQSPNIAASKWQAEQPGTVTNPGWQSSLSSKFPKRAASFDLPGATSSASPSWQGELPPVPQGEPAPFPTVQSKGAPPIGAAAGLPQTPEATRYIAEKAAMGHELSPAEEEILRQHVQSTFVPETSMDAAASKAGRMYAGRGTQFRPTNEQLSMGSQAAPPSISSPGASQGLPQGRQNLFEIASPMGNGGIKLETDSLGIRWAVSPEGYRVSIPKGVTNVEEYAGPKLAEQAQIHKGLK